MAKENNYQIIHVEGELLSQQLRRQHERSIREAEASKNPDLIGTDEFWNCWLCRKISYDLLHGTFIPGVNFNIDTALQAILLIGFYILFPEYPKSLETLTKAQIKKKEKLLACWRFLFLNSCAAIRDRNEAISLSFTRSNYQKNGPYHSEYWSYTELQAVTQKAVEAGYFRKFRGRNYQDAESYITRLEILDRFRDLIDDYVSSLKLSDDVCVSKELTGYDLVMNFPMPKPAKPALVIKHDDDSSTLPSLNNRSTEQMYNRVVKYNEFMQQQEMALSVDLDSLANTHLEILFHAVTRNELVLLNPERVFECQRPSGILQKFKDKYTYLRTVDSQCGNTDNNSRATRHPIPPYTQEISTQHTQYTYHQLYPAKNSDLLYDYSQLLVPNRAELLFLQNRYWCYRSFKKTMTNGGRFYGIINQQLPSNIRLRTIINGVPVAELDYKALHPSLIYSFVGIQPPEDIYDVFDQGDERYRKLIKLIALIVFNAANERSALNAIRKEYSEEYDVMLKDGTLKSGIELFFEHNPKLRKYRYSGVGGSLQYQDSKIMDKILSRLTKLEIPAIPIHDSVIVPYEYAEVTQNFMEQAYQQITDTDHVPFITTEYGPASDNER